jgi:UDP-N-acetylmuramoyl-tripeptide--D-alanyl-D-alanine ligase
VIARPLSAIARETGGRLEGGDPDISSVVIDSRLAVPGSLFVALPGERTDGVRFVHDAVARGAAAVLVPDREAATGPSVLVSSTGEALLKLAAAERRHVRARVVAITGANGKTSTKDLAAAVLSRRFRTHGSPGSFNNEIGLPMTLLGAPADTEVIVAELGARRKGDVALLSEIAKPEIAVVTNVGVAHLEIFGSWEAIVEASAEPVEALASGAWAVLNADDQVAAGYRSRTAAEVVTFGRLQGADVRADDVRLGPDGTASFRLVAGDDRAQVRLNVAGEHMVANALAATAVGRILGVPLADAAEALGAATISRWRMETFTTGSGVRVINDAYNANPESVAAALKAARVMAGGGRLIAVLGHMAEIAPLAEEAHDRIGDLAARLGVARLVVVGAQAARIAVAAVREGVEPENVAAYEEPALALGDVREHARPGDVVLFKGSRVAGLEVLAEGLR